MTKKHKYIKAIRLYHFQSYVDETLVFDPQSNAFVGRTDAGKSAVTRALYWALYNRPVRLGRKDKGDEFTTWGEKHCFVIVYFSDGTKIVRGRKDDENYYLLEDAEGTKTEFKGFGFEVPEQIVEAHGMPYMKFDDDSNFSLNISQQLDPIFLFEDSASKRAKTIGKISGADKVDGASMIMHGWHRDAVNKRKDLIASIESLTRKVKEYDFIDNLDEAIATLAELITSVSKTETVRNLLVDQYNALLQAEIQRKQLLAVIAHEEQLIELRQLEEFLTKSTRELHALDTVFNAFKTSTAEHQNLITILEAAEKVQELGNYLELIQSKTALRDRIAEQFIDLYALEQELNSTTNMLKQANSFEEVIQAMELLNTCLGELNELNALYTGFLDNQKRAEKGRGIIRELETSLNDLQKRYKAYLTKMQVCPVCGAEITAEQIDHIL